ncbi:MAG: hypothetical protein Q4C35_07855 [Eubacteriales bacterium]|nr:hypothetical protein [Eubacteriales bacterium]
MMMSVHPNDEVRESRVLNTLKTPPFQEATPHPAFARRAGNRLQKAAFSTLTVKFDDTFSLYHNQVARVYSKKRQFLNGTAFFIPYKSTFCRILRSWMQHCLFSVLLQLFRKKNSFCLV